VKKTECVGGDRKTCDMDGRMRVYGKMEACVRACVRVLIYGNGYSVTLQCCVH
jgi:hypothetical protein